MGLQEKELVVSQVRVLTVPTPVDLRSQNFLNETTGWEGGDNKGPQVPFYLFSTDQSYREQFLIPLIRAGRVEAIREYEENKKNFLVKTEVQSMGMNEFNLDDVKAMLAGNLRLSARKVSVRKSQLGGRKIPKSREGERWGG